MVKHPRGQRRSLPAVATEFFVKWSLVSCMLSPQITRPRAVCGRFLWSLNNLPHCRGTLGWTLP